jgi:hypothetical protein
MPSASQVLVNQDGFDGLGFAEQVGALGHLGRRPA